MNIVVLAGGISPERDVSLSSGRMIYQALKKRGHCPILLDVYLGLSTEGGFGAINLDGMQREVEPKGAKGEGITQLFSMDIDWIKGITAVGEENPNLDEIKALRADGERIFFGPHVLELCQASDVVFMALHGESGENGKIQACFDLMGITYTGTDYLSSALAMDKGLAKELFGYHGIPTPPGILLKQGEQVKTKVPFPCIIKANSGGSSVGVRVANNETEYNEALAEAYLYDNEAVIEQFIKGREFSVGVLAGKALPIIEIAPINGFYDYKNKYQPGNAVETCPADLSPAKTAEIKQWAEKVFKVLRLSNYARMDFMMDEQGAVYCLEANTLPGMTATSLLPQEAAAVGIDFPELCEIIINTALEH
ncbi:MAG: D-alanine--D-alanine ligase [Lachnospiraceae bacterium]|nr:D-alanine--D-alanine ligase [Lachnospiraceae bacterium]